MRLNPYIYVEIAGRAAACAGISFARQANALAVARAWLDAHLQRLSVVHHAFATAHAANRPRFAGAIAARASDIELHVAGFLRDLPFAIAFWAGAGSFDVAVAAAVLARVVARYIQAQHAAANRCPERHVDLIFK